MSHRAEVEALQELSCTLQSLWNEATLWRVGSETFKDALMAEKIRVNTRIAVLFWDVKPEDVKADGSQW